MRVAVVAGQAAHGDLVERALGQDGDAVEALLAVHRDVVAELLEGLGRERLGRALLISWKQATSGAASLSQVTALSSRALTPLMFQVAIFMAAL